MTRTTRQLVLDGHAPGVRGDARSVTHGTDLHLMRESNRLLVLNCVRKHGAIARADVARYTGLSRTTVGTLVDSLVKEGLIREGDSQRALPSGGRRIIPLHFNAQAGYILGVAMGRSHVTILLSDLSANIVKRGEVSFNTERGPDICLPELAARLRSVVAEQRIAWSRVVGVGLGMPGPIDADLRGPVVAPRMPGWSGVNARNILSDELGKPVYVDNNANLGALGEIRFGVGSDVSSLLYVKIGSGIGSGLIIHGQIYRGGSGSAGEIGHMMIAPEGILCDCGNRGCLETVAGKAAILDEARRGAPQVESVADVIAAAQSGDAACRVALEHAGTAIGTVLASIVNFFNPSVIVVDGSTMCAGELMLDPIRKAVAARALAAPLAHMEIVPAALAGHAIALGGVATVIDIAFSAQGLLAFSRGA